MSGNSDTPTLMQGIEELLMKDQGIAAGQEQVLKDVQVADKLAQDITADLVKKIMNEDGEVNMQHAVLSLARSMTYLGQFAYESAEEFGADVEKARVMAADRLVVALENPQPCGTCESCNEDMPCDTPEVESENTRTRFMPLLASALLEYDHWCKTLYKNISHDIQGELAQAGL